MITANPVETIRLGSGFKIRANDFLLGRTVDHIISPCLTILRARLGASENAVNFVSSTFPVETEEISI